MAPAQLPDPPARAWIFPVSAMGLAFLLSLVTGLVTLRDFPNSGDEYAYWISARIFAEGKLSVPSPPYREFFDFVYVVNDGRFYGKYPPGWPLLLAGGMVVGAPWLVNPLLGALAVGVIWAIARENLSEEAARRAVVLTAANPFLVFNSASYFSHAAGLLLAACVVWLGLRCARQPERFAAWLGLGASFGGLFLVRPYTAAALAIPLGAFLVHESVHGPPGRRWLRGWAGAALPASACAVAFLTYNYLQTGHPLLQPFTLYNPGDRPGFRDTEHFRWALGFNLVDRLIDFAIWIPGSLLLLGAAPFSVRGRTAAVVPLLLAVPSVIFVAYFFYGFHPGNQYGPRYLYESSFAVFALGGAVLARPGRFGLAACGLAVAANAALLGVETARRGAEVRGRMDVYDRAREQGLANAVVFLKTGSGSMPPLDLTRNGIRFDGPVLYVLDRGRANARLLRALNGRQTYAYSFDGRTQTGRLLRYDPLLDER